MIICFNPIEHTCFETLEIRNSSKFELMCNVKIFIFDSEKIIYIYI